MPRAMASLPAGMAVLVVDHGSTDRTQEIARSRGAHVVQRSFYGFVEARRFAISHVRTPWTLMIDADEMLDERLRSAIAETGGHYNGYLLARTTFYGDRALRMWRNEPLLRFFKTGHVRVEPAPAAGGNAQLHERWDCDPPIGRLEGMLLHYSYPSHAAYREKYDRYTSIEALGFEPSRFHVAVETLRAIPRFLWYVTARGALLDGVTGVRIAWLSALYPAMVRIKALRNT